MVRLQLRMLVMRERGQWVKCSVLTALFSASEWSVVCLFRDETFGFRVTYT
jgi:hypothetical protein